MSYATIADLNNRITQTELMRLTDEDDDGIVIIETVQAALDAAGLEIDSYLAGNYTMPISNPILITLAVDIAIWNLYALDTSGAPDGRRERYQTAIKTLERISTDRKVLGQLSAGASFITSGRIFNRGNMEGL